MKPRFKLASSGALLVTFFTFTASPVRAADRFWDGTSTTADADGGAGAWTTGGLNWDDLAIGGADTAWADGDTAIFGTTTAASAVTVTTAVTAGGITFNTTGYTVSGGSITLNGTATINTVANATVSSILSATTANVTKTGAGQLTLSGVNLHTGTTLISEGTLKVGNTAALGAAGTGTTVSAGATLDVAGTILGAEVVTISGAGVAGVGAINNAGTTAQQQALRFVTLAADASIGVAARMDIRKPTGLTAELNMGAFTLTKVGASDFHLTGVTVTNPGKIVANSGQFWLEDVTLLGGVPATNTLLVKTGASLYQWNNNQAHAWGLNFEAGTFWDSNSGTSQWVGPITVAAGVTTLQGGGTENVFGVISGAGKLTKIGTGKFNLIAANTYTGNTDVNAGTLQLGDTIATDYGVTGRIRGTVTVNTGGTLLLQGRNVLGYGAGVKVDTLNITGGTVTHAGSGDNGWGLAYVMTGGLLQNTGSGTFSMGGITGNPAATTTVTTLAATAPATITGAINLRDGNTGNTVPFTTADGPPVNDLIVNSSIVSPVTGITKNGPGTMLYQGAGTYSGATVINAGSLVLSPTGTITLSPITVNGGSLAVSTTGKTFTSLTTADGAGLVLPAITGGTTTVTGTALFNGTTLNVTPLIGSGGVGTTYDLLTAGTLTATATPVLNMSGAYGPSRAAGNLAVVGNILKFTLTTAGANLTWNNAAGGGVANGTWDGTLANFHNSVSNLDEAFQAFDSVLFTDTPLSGTAKVVTVSGNRAPAQIAVVNSTSPYTFTAATNGEGQLVGGGSLLKSGTSSLTLGANLAYNMTGGISVTGGTLDLGGKTLPNQSALVVSGTTTTLSNGTVPANAISADSGTISATMNGTATLTKNTADTLTLTAVNGYTGGTNVNAGKLQLGNGGAGGAAGNGGTITLASGTTLEIFRSDSPTFTAAYAGTGQIIFRGINPGGTSAAVNSTFYHSGNSSTLTAANQVSVINARLTLDNPNDIGLATITNSSFGQVYALNTTLGNNLVLTGDGWGEPNGPFGAIRAVNSTLNGTITLAGNSRMSTNGGGTVFSNLNGVISDGPNDFNLTLGIAAAVSNFNLNAANTYSGTTTIQNSNVNVNGSLASATTVDATSVLGGNGTINNNLTFLTTAGISVNLGLPGNLKVNGNVNLGTTNAVALAINSPLAPGGSIPVLSYTGTLTGTTANLAMANPTNYRNAVFTIDTVAIPHLISVNLGSKAITWTGTGGTTWNIGTTGNWVDSTPVASAYYQADEVTFTDSATAANSTIAISGLVQPSKVTFNNTTAVPYSFTGAAGNAITGGASLVKNGNGPVTFATPNAYTGSTTVNAGTLTYATGSNYSNVATAAITVNSGATFAMNKLDLFGNHAAAVAVPVVVNGGTYSTTTFNGMGAITLNGGTLVSTSGNDVVYQSFALKGAITVIGNTTSTIASSGTNSDMHLGSGAFLGTTFDVADGTQPIDLFASASFRNGIATAGSLPQASSLTKTGAGTMVLSGTNSYTGVTTISGGTLQIGNGGATGTLGAGAIVNNAALVFNRDASGDLTVASAISGTGSVSQSGAGTTILSGANTYSGNTLVNTGILSITSATLNDTSTVRIASAGKLNLNYTGTDDVKVLFLNGAAQVAGTWGRAGSGAAHETSLITGDGILNVLTTGSDPYGDWATLKGLDAGNKASNLNPDDDGLNNLGEYAFDGNPLSGKADGKIVTKMVDIDGKKVLTLTLPVRDNTLFNVPSSTAMISTPKDGIVYTIEGSSTLFGFPLQITEIPAITAGVVTPTAGWTLRTFRTPGTPTTGNPNTTPKEFLRARVTEQP